MNFRVFVFPFIYLQCVFTILNLTAYTQSASHSYTACLVLCIFEHEISRITGQTLFLNILSYCHRKHAEAISIRFFLSQVPSSQSDNLLSIAFLFLRGKRVSGRGNHHAILGFGVTNIAKMLHQFGCVHLNFCASMGQF